MKAKAKPKSKVRATPKPFPEQQLIDWARVGLNPFEEEQVSVVHGPRLTQDALVQYITDPTRWFSPVCRAVLELQKRNQELEAALRHERARSGNDNPFAAEEPFQVFPKLKAFFETASGVDVEGAIEIRHELESLMEELRGRREFMNKPRTG